MGLGFHQTTIIGNLGDDPGNRLKYINTQDGEKAVITIGVAVTDYNDNTEWYDCTFWGKRAETLLQFAAKGSRIFLQAQKRTRSYEAQDGTQRKATEWVVNEMNILTFAGDNQPETTGTTQTTRQPSPQSSTSRRPAQGSSRSGGSSPSRQSAGSNRSNPTGRSAPQAPSHRGGQQSYARRGPAAPPPVEDYGSPEEALWADDEYDAPASAGEDFQE